MAMLNHRNSLLPKASPMDTTQLFPHFWLAPSTNLSVPELNEWMMGNAEEAFGVKFPRLFLTLLVRQNGGYLRKDSIKAVNGQSIRIEYLNGLGVESVDNARRGAMQDWQLENGLVPISIHEEGGLCLDYRNDAESDNPALVWYDDRQKSDTPVASDFESFIKNLYDSNPAFIFGFEDIEDKEDMQDLLDELHSVIGAEFDAMESFFHVSHSEWKIAGSNDPVEFTLRPNGVSKSNPDYPESPDATWLLEIDCDPQRATWLAAQIKDTVGVDFVRVHTPR